MHEQRRWGVLSSLLGLERVGGSHGSRDRTGENLPGHRRGLYRRLVETLPWMARRVADLSGAERELADWVRRG